MPAPKAEIAKPTMAEHVRVPISRKLIVCDPNADFFIVCHSRKPVNWPQSNVVRVRRGPRDLDHIR